MGGCLLPDTRINWVRATPGGKNIPDGGTTTSTKVIVDSQGTVAGRGSHMDLKIDSGSYVPVASPHTPHHRATSGGCVDGATHEIYLRAVDKKQQRQIVRGRSCSICGGS
jgi:hypothetical protein